MRKLGCCLALAAGLASPAFTQKLDPIQWSFEPVSAAKGGETLLKLTARMEEPWHLYSLTTPKGGPIVTTIKLEPNPAVESYRLFQQKPVRQLDKNFNLDTETFDKEAVFAIIAKLAPGVAAGPLEITAKARYQACTETRCLPPRTKTVVAKLVIAPGAPEKATPPEGLIEVPVATEVPSGTPTAAPAPTPKPNASSPAQAQDLGPFLLTALGLGLAAIFTPCVFPMIPFVMSGFLNRDTGSRAQGVFQAGLFSLGIIVLFCLLGFAVTAILGPFGVVQLGSNPWVNGFIALLFLAFGLSLLGAFEITLPVWLTTKVDSASRQGGSVGTLLMSLSFALTSFACVGPFVGTLLAGSIQSKGVRPLLGMTFFSIGLAAPFFFLALFPQYLKRLPKSGGWLARVKVVMGFIVLAALIKYLSNIDQVLQLGILTRERFLAAWLVFFLLAGLYLLGFLRLEGVRSEDEMGVGRLLTASAFLIFAFSLVPGLFGARLGELDAYVPPAGESSGLCPAGSGATASENSRWLKNQFPEALAQAKQENKLVLINFTGYACTNCHWMKQNMFPRPEIQAALKDFVLVELYTDGTDPASEANQKLQESRYQTVAIPFYAIINANEQTVATFDRLTKNAPEFLEFLNSRGS